MSDGVRSGFQSREGRQLKSGESWVAVERRGQCCSMQCDMPYHKKARNIGAGSEETLSPDSPGFNVVVMSVRQPIGAGCSWGRAERLALYFTVGLVNIISHNTLEYGSPQELKSVGTWVCGGKRGDERGRKWLGDCRTDNCQDLSDRQGLRAHNATGWALLLLSIDHLSTHDPVSSCSRRVSSSPLPQPSPGLSHLRGLFSTRTSFERKREAAASSS